MNLILQNSRVRDCRSFPFLLSSYSITRNKSEAATVDFNWTVSWTTPHPVVRHPPRGTRYSYPPEISIESCRIFTVAASGKSLWCRWKSNWQRLGTIVRVFPGTDSSEYSQPGRTTPHCAESWAKDWATRCKEVKGDPVITEITVRPHVQRGPLSRFSYRQCRPPRISIHHPLLINDSFPSNWFLKTRCSTIWNRSDSFDGGREKGGSVDRGWWAIRICNQVQSKRVNLGGVCTLAAKLVPYSTPGRDTPPSLGKLHHRDVTTLVRVSVREIVRGGEMRYGRSVLSLSLSVIFPLCLRWIPSQGWFPPQGDRECQDASKLRFTFPPS